MINYKQLWQQATRLREKEAVELQRLKKENESLRHELLESSSLKTFDLRKAAALRTQARFGGRDLPVIR